MWPDASPAVFFFNDTATTEIYTLSLHDALPICWKRRCSSSNPKSQADTAATCRLRRRMWARWEEHTSELQSPCNLVCRVLLEKKIFGRSRCTLDNTSIVIRRMHARSLWP